MKKVILHFRQGAGRIVLLIRVNIFWQPALYCCTVAVTPELHWLNPGEVNCSSV